MSYENLIVWQKSMQLVELVYAFTSSFPDSEKYGLTNQMKRAAVSIPSNIAEGRHRSSKADYVRFLYISFGSTKELLTQAQIAERLKFTSNKDSMNLIRHITEVSKMLHGLIKKLDRTI